MLLSVNGVLQCNVLKANICESEFCIGKKNLCVRYEMSSPSNSPSTAFHLTDESFILLKCENFKLCLSYINWDCWCASKKIVFKKYLSFIKSKNSRN